MCMLYAVSMYGTTNGPPSIRSLQLLYAISSPPLPPVFFCPLAPWQCPHIVHGPVFSVEPHTQYVILCPFIPSQCVVFRILPIRIRCYHLSIIYFLSSVLSTCLFPPFILSLSSMLFARVKYRCFNALHWVADFVMICLSSPLFPVSVQMSNQLAQCVDRSVTQSLPSRARPPLLLPNNPFSPLPFVCPFIRV